MDLQRCEMSRDRVSLRTTASGCSVEDVIIAETVRSLRGGNPPSTGEQVDGSFRLPDLLTLPPPREMRNCSRTGYPHSLS